jgi:prepilin-type N-terminal cleavage/methylation domain-containing protein
MSANRSGFTLVEMLVAVTILGTGILALAAGSGGVTRALTGSRISTNAAQRASEQMDLLRVRSRATLIQCSHPSFASSEGTLVRQNVALSWTVTPTGKIRTDTVTATYKTGRNQVRTETFSSQIPCPA